MANGSNRIILQFEDQHSERIEIFKANRDNAICDNLIEGKWYAVKLLNPPFDMDWADEPLGPFQTDHEAFKAVISITKE